MLKVHIINAGHGDCILLDFEHTRILIDCGPKTFKIRKNVISVLKQLLAPNKIIDIAVVTHNDDDHIGGFKYLIENNIKIEKIVFNSLYDIPDIINSLTPQISFKQDNALRKQLLEEQSINVSTLTKESDPIEINGIKITAITPTIEALEDLIQAYDSKEIQRGEGGRHLLPVQISNHKKTEISLKECLFNIQHNKDFFVKDLSKPNKSGIALIIEYKFFNGIFLADTHEEDIIIGIKEKGYENTVFNLTKLSHHGSDKNTSTELLQLIGKTQYILCADKSKHQHPNNLTLARILSFDSNPTIHFSTYKENISDLLDELDSLNISIHSTFSENNLNTISYE